MLAEALRDILRAARLGPPPQGIAQRNNDSGDDDNNPRPRQARRVTADGVLVASGTEVQIDDSQSTSTDFVEDRSGNRTPESANTLIQVPNAPTKKVPAEPHQEIPGQTACGYTPSSPPASEWDYTKGFISI